MVCSERGNNLSRPTRKRFTVLSRGQSPQPFVPLTWLMVGVLNFLPGQKIKHTNVRITYKLLTLIFSCIFLVLKAELQWNDGAGLTLWPSISKEDRCRGTPCTATDTSQAADIITWTCAVLWSSQGTAADLRSLFWITEFLCWWVEDWSLVPLASLDL